MAIVEVMFLYINKNVKYDLNVIKNQNIFLILKLVRLYH